MAEQKDKIQKDSGGQRGGGLTSSGDRGGSDGDNTSGSHLRDETPARPGGDEELNEAVKRVDPEGHTYQAPTTRE